MHIQKTILNLSRLTRSGTRSIVIYGTLRTNKSYICILISNILTETVLIVEDSRINRDHFGYSPYLFAKYLVQLIKVTFYSPTIFLNISMTRYFGRF